MELNELLLDSATFLSN